MGAEGDNDMAGTRFFVPNGWPVPPAGWLPPTNWRPAPEWPAAPAGWGFYRGDYGQPVPTPPGCWVPPAPVVPGAGPTGSTLPPVPGFPASAVSGASGPIPYVAAQPSARPPSSTGRRPPVWVWIAAAGAALVLVLAVVLILPRFTRGPELTSSQFDRLTVDASQSLGGVGYANQEQELELEGPLSSYDACEAAYDAMGDHYRTGYYSETEPWVWAELFDSVEAASDYYRDDMECTRHESEDDPYLWRVEQQGNTSGAEWALWTGTDMDDRVMVRYGNVIASAQVDTDTDRSRFVERLVEQINDIAR